MPMLGGGAGLSEAEVVELISGNASSGIRVWEAGELAYTNNFDAPLAALWDVQGGWGPGAVSIQPASSAPAGAPAFDNFLRFVNTDGSAPEGFLYLDRIPALADKSPVLLKFWAYVVNGSGIAVKESGLTRASLATNGSWERVTATLSGALSYLHFRDERYSESWIGGLEIYVESAHPFMLNDLAIYDNQVYQSKMDNNPHEPGTDATWEAVLVQTSITSLEARVTALENASGGGL